MLRAGAAAVVFLLSLGAASPARAAWPPEGWVYWLQGINLDDIVDLAPDVAVIDYSSTGGASGEWSAAEIQALRDAGVTVLAYFSIGEAEDYRWYWQAGWTPGDPEWLGPENPDWHGNYKVRFWMDGWRQILFGVPEGPDESTLDRILDQGFDGMYLDIVDAYDYWSRENPENPNAPHLMVELLHDLAEYAQVTRGRPDFLVIPQNGEWLPEDAPGADRPVYYAAVDGIGAEDAFYYGEADENNPYNPRPGLEMLDTMVDSGKVVLSVEYLTDPGPVDQYYSLALARGFVPLATVRELDQLVYRDPAPVDGPAGRGGSALPGEITLVPYPNPFNSAVRVMMALPRAGLLRVGVYDLAGRRVARLYDGLTGPGERELVWRPSPGTASGVYLLRLSTGSRTAARKVVYLK